MTSNVEWICGDETLGIPIVSDKLSPWHGQRPIPAVMCSQLEIIAYSTLLQPFRDELLERLEKLIKANKRYYWYTIYLTMFLLLHSCAMITRRDQEVARQTQCAVRRTYSYLTGQVCPAGLTVNSTVSLLQRKKHQGPSQWFNHHAGAFPLCQQRVQGLLPSCRSKTTRRNQAGSCANRSRAWLYHQDE
jgi:hypothetical protein